MTQSKAQSAALEPAAEAAPAALAWSTRLAVVILLALVAVRTLNAAALFPRLTNDTSEFSTRARALPHTGEVRFEATDGTRLYGWVTGLDTAPRKILFTCGNGGHVPRNGERMADVARLSTLQVLVFDYRGYYLSGSQPQPRAGDTRMRVEHGCLRPDNLAGNRHRSWFGATRWAQRWR